jgi:hypothetical protein
LNTNQDEIKLIFGDLYMKKWYGAASVILLIGLVIILFIRNKQNSNTEVLARSKYPYPEYSEIACKNAASIGLPMDSGLRDSHIVYLINRRESDQATAWVTALDGSSSKALPKYPGSAFGIGFLKNDRQFAIIGNGDVTVGDIDGAEPITTKSTAELQANFVPYTSMWNYLATSRSPLEGTGRFVAPDMQSAMAWTEGAGALTLLDHQGQVVRKVIETGKQDEIEGVWTSDSEWFVFLQVRNSTYENVHQAWMARADGTEIIALTPRESGAVWGRPVISPDNQKVAFDYLFAEGVNHTQLRVIWLDEQNPKSQTFDLEEGINLESSLSSETFVWSPDSQWVAFMNVWAEKDYGGVDIHALDIGRGKVYCVTNDISGKTLMDWK